jgi:hypothetical protein
MDDFFLFELFLISAVKKASNTIIKVYVIASFIDNSPVSSVSRKTMLTNTINDMVMYSGLNFVTFCNLVNLQKMIKHGFFAY